TAPSAALPSSSSIRMAACEASQWVLETIPWVPVRVGLVVKVGIRPGWPARARAAARPGPGGRRGGGHGRSSDHLLGQGFGQRTTLQRQRAEPAGPQPQAQVVVTHDVDGRNDGCEPARDGADEEGPPGPPVLPD